MLRLFPSGRGERPIGLETLSPKEVEPVAWVVGLDDKGDEEVVDDQVDDQNPEQALGFLEHGTLGPGKEEDDKESASHKGHIKEDSGVEDGLQGVGDAKAEETTQNGEAGVDEKEFVPKADEVDADKETPDFACISFGWHRPLAEEFVIEEFAVTPFVGF